LLTEKVGGGLPVAVNVYDQESPAIAVDGGVSAVNAGGVPPPAVGSCSQPLTAVESWIVQPDTVRLSVPVLDAFSSITLTDPLPDALT